MGLGPGPLLPGQAPLGRESPHAACEDPYQPQHFLIPDLDHSLLGEKLHGPLYAAAIILAANTQRTVAGLGSLVHQYQGSHNQLAIRVEAAWARQWPDNEFPDLASWRRAICLREILVPGMLLNVCELAGIVHLPSPGIPSERAPAGHDPDPPAAQAGFGSPTL